MAVKLGKNDYDNLCKVCTTGDTEGFEKILSELPNAAEEDRKYPLCPDPTLHVNSPLVLAAQHGHLSIAKHLMDKFKESIDINKGATIISRTTKKKVHHATPLWAACTGGHIELVRFFISQGADVNKTTLTLSTPLRGASFHGYIEIMQCLLDNGANLNTPNCIGQSPLCIAAMRGETEAVRFLLNCGADHTQSTINGYTVMHLAAAKGKQDVIQVLLDHGVSPMFQPANPLATNYVPCPLYLAASTGQQKAVEALLEREDCPVECKADTYLLLAAMQCELRRRVRVTETRVQEPWEKGLKMYHENNITPVKLPLKECYMFQEEVLTVEGLSSVWHSATFAHLEVFLQSLIIRERCMGFLDQGLIYFLIRRGTYFCQGGHCREAELLWKHAMEMEILVCEVEINHETYGHCEGILRDLEKDLNMYVNGIQEMLEGGYQPNFPMYLRYGLKEIDILDRLSGKADAEIIDNETLINTILELFLTWINSSGSSQKKRSLECDELGNQFVSKYLHFKSGTTLLHHVLTNFSVTENNTRRILDRFPSLVPLVAAIIAWGGYKVIDQPDHNGLRPIHIAASLTDDEETHELLTPLMEGGVHLDAVDKNGRRADELCSKPSQQTVVYNTGAPSLYCLSARSIVAHSISYQSLPSHVRQFISFHDKKCVL